MPLGELVAVRPRDLVDAQHYVVGAELGLLGPVGDFGSQRFARIVGFDVVAEENREGAEAGSLVLLHRLIEFLQQLEEGRTRLSGRGKDHDGRIESVFADETVELALPFAGGVERLERTGDLLARLRTGIA